MRLPDKLPAVVPERREARDGRRRVQRGVYARRPQPDRVAGSP